MTDYKKTGYLNYNFKVFHLSDHHAREFSYHYHDFHKILLFVNGSVTYHVEGKSYPLQPYDLVLVRAGEVHRPVIQSDTIYERIIIYISPDFLRSYDQPGESLERCFTDPALNNSNVLRIPSFRKSRAYEICRELTQESPSSFQNALYAKNLFLEFMIHINRMCFTKDASYLETASSNEKILSILSYISEHLTDDISIDSLAQKFYISKYHLMHTFKEETGYTLGCYLSTKRLLLARNLIDNDMPVTDACYACGYHNYSTFSRAYKKLFHHSASLQKKGVAP